MNLGDDWVSYCGKEYKRTHSGFIVRCKPDYIKNTMEIMDLGPETNPVSTPGAVQTSAEVQESENEEPLNPIDHH